MRLKTIPSLEQVHMLPRYFARTVPPEFLDQNGHMNIQHYFGLYNEAGGAFFQSMGVDLTYFTERRLGIFDLEHHVWYLAECHAGDEVAVYGRTLARSEKRMHGVWFVTNESRRAVSCIFEFLSSHADLDARRTSAFPDDVAGSIDALIAKDAALPWPAPVSGVITP